MRYSLDTLDGFALDMGGTKIAAARFEKGKIGTYAKSQTDGFGNPEQLIAQCADLLRETGFEKGETLGIAVTGRIDRAGHWHAVNQHTLSKVCDIPLGQLVRDQFGHQAPVINDAVAAILGEYRYGAGKRCEALGFVTISTGVGGAFLLDGKPIASPNGLAGHCGFLTSRLADRQCGSGRFATVESVASGTAIGRAAAAIDAQCPTAKAAFDASADGDQRFESVIENAAMAIAEMSGNLSAILGLERILIGGSVGLAPGFVERIRKHQQREPELFRPSIQPSALAHDNVLFGALSHALCFERRGG